jgi:hypothetical protein
MQVRDPPVATAHSRRSGAHRWLLSLRWGEVAQGLQFAKAYSCGAQDSMVVVRTRVPGSARIDPDKPLALIGSTRAR